MAGRELAAAVEAVLFACGSPVEQDKLTSLLGLSLTELEEVCEIIRKRLEEPESGITLIKVESAYQLCTKPFVAEFVKRALEMRKMPPLSKAALEVLAIIAYNQPVTRSYIEIVRGVDSSYIVSGLCDKGLVAESGTLDAPGRPVLFSTTDSFLRCFGLNSLSELPEYPGIIKDSQLTLGLEDETPGETELSQPE